MLPIKHGPRIAVPRGAVGGQIHHTKKNTKNYKKKNENFKWNAEELIKNLESAFYLRFC